MARKQVSRQVDENGLTIKQEAFCRAFVETGNASEAYRRSYDAENMKFSTINSKACLLLGGDKVRARVDQLRAISTAKAVKKLEISKEWVLSELVDNVRKAKASEPVLINGEPSGEYQINLAAANRALELIGKELKMFVDRKEIKTGPLDDLDDTDLQKVDDALAEIERAFTGSGKGITH